MLVHCCQRPGRKRVKNSLSMSGRNIGSVLLIAVFGTPGEQQTVTDIILCKHFAHEHTPLQILMSMFWSRCQVTYLANMFQIQIPARLWSHHRKIMGKMRDIQWGTTWNSCTDRGDWDSWNTDPVIDQAMSNRTRAVLLLLTRLFGCTHSSCKFRYVHFHVQTAVMLGCRGFWACSSVASCSCFFLVFVHGEIPVDVSCRTNSSQQDSGYLLPGAAR